MRYITGRNVLGSKLHSVTLYITALIVLRIEYAIIYAPMVSCKSVSQRVIDMLFLAGIYLGSNRLSLPIWLLGSPCRWMTAGNKALLHAFRRSFLQTPVSPSLWRTPQPLRFYLPVPILTAWLLCVDSLLWLERGSSYK